MALHVLIGAAVGALVGAGASVVRSWVKDEPINWKSVAAGAVGGAATGAIATATFGAGLLAGSAGAQIAGMAVAGGTGAALEQSTDNVLHDKEWHEGVARSAMVGTAAGALGGVGRQVAPSVLGAIGRWGPAQAAGRQAQRVFAPVVSTANRVAAPVVNAAKHSWGLYMQAMKRWPMRTKVATSGTLTLVADLLSQKFEGRTSWDWKRTAFRTAWGMAIAAPVGHYWMAGLDKMIKGTGILATSGKVALDQFLVSPIFTAAFFGSYAMVHDGATPQEAWEKIKSDVPRAMLASVSIWPAVNFVKFKTVPLDMRVPFGKAFGVAYSVFFGMFFLAEDGAEGEGPAARDEEQNGPLDRPQRVDRSTVAAFGSAWDRMAQNYELLMADGGPSQARNGLQQVGARYEDAWDTTWASHDPWAADAEGTGLTEGAADAEGTGLTEALETRLAPSH